jgi:protein-disulfide isomerase
MTMTPSPYVAAFAMSVLFLGPSATQQSPTTGDQPVAVIGSETLTASELDRLASGRMSKLRTEEYRIRRTAIEEWIAARLLDRAAKQRNMSVDDLIRSEVDLKVPEVTVAEARAVFETTQGGRGTFDEQTAMLDSIRQDLRTRRLARRKQQFVMELRRAAQPSVLLDQPRVAVSAGDRPSRGPADARVTMIVWSDYECPYCAQLMPVLDTVMDRYRNTVRLVYRHFPLDNHRNATKAAEAADCAGDQGRFWDMHALMFKNPKQLTPPDLQKHADTLQLDSRRFAECLQSSRFAKLWQEDRNAGAASGVSGTPTTFVNGRMLPGIVSVEALVQTIEEELAAARPKQ